MIIRLTLLLLVILQPIYGTGSVILLYGTPCSGKSTLANRITKEFKQFKIVKKTEATFEKQREIVKQFTGQLVETRDQFLAIKTTLPEDVLEQLSLAEFNVINDVVSNALTRAKQGEHLILDLCLKGSKLPVPHPLMTQIFVYAPLDLISKRDESRAKEKSHSPLFQAHRRKAILSFFSTFFRPKLNHEIPFDVLRKDTLLSFGEVHKQKIAYPVIDQVVQEIFIKFGLTDKTVVEIYPVLHPDIIINTGIMTLEESIQKIKNYLGARFAS